MARANLTQYIQNDLSLCCSRHGAQRDLAHFALSNWHDDEQKRLLKAAYNEVQFKPGLDDEWGELKRLVALLVLERDTPDETERYRRAATVALAQFIWRVKNHMRGRWQHKAHLMPVLYGPSGSGKTSAVTHLLAPLPEMHMDVDFGLLKDNSKSYDLSTMPIMIFEEMAGASKSDVNDIKRSCTRRPNSRGKLSGRNDSHSHVDLHWLLEQGHQRHDPG